MPTGLGSLLSGRILSNIIEDDIVEERSVKRRILSCEQKSCSTPVRRCNSNVEEYRLKRPPTSILDISRKRHKPLRETQQSEKGTLFQFGFTKLPQQPDARTRTLVHSASDSDMSIKLALQRCKFNTG